MPHPFDSPAPPAGSSADRPADRHGSRHDSQQDDQPAASASGASPAVAPVTAPPSDDARSARPYDIGSMPIDTLRALFRAVFDNAAEAIFLIDEAGNIADINAVGLARMGYELHELVGLPFAMLLDETTAPLMVQRLQLARSRGRAVFESCHVTRSGERVYVEVVDTLITLDDRQYVMCVARDISQRRVADEAMSHRLRLERLVSSMTTLHANASPDRVGPVIDATLAGVGEFLDADRSYLFQVRDNGLLDNTNVWCAPGIADFGERMRGMQPDALPWWMEQFGRGESVVVHDVSDLPSEAFRERAIMDEQGIRAQVCVPLMYNKRLRGFLGLDQCRAGRLWSDEDLTLLESLLNSIGHMLDRAETLGKMQAERLLLSDIINALNIHIAVVDADGCISNANNAWREAQQEMHCTAGCVRLPIGDGGGSARHARSDEAEKGISDVLDGITTNFQMEYATPDTDRSFLLQVTPLQGEVRGAVIARTEVTRLRQAERNLAQSERLFRSLMQNMQEGLVLLDHAGTVLHANMRFGAMLGTESKAVSGRGIAELAVPESREVLERIPALGSGAVLKSEEVVWRHGEGNRVFTLCSTAPVVAPDGQPGGIFLVVTDITERRVLQNQLMQAQKLESIGQLAAGIAHEINTPAQYVSNNVAFLRQASGVVGDLLTRGLAVLRTAGADNPLAQDAAQVLEGAESADVEYLLEEIPRALAESEDGVGRISTIVRSVKQFAHPGSETVAPVDINAAIESTVNVSRNEWKYVADLDLQLDPSMPLVPCVAGEFNQVVLNLIVNAAHAIEDKLGRNSGQKGRITVGTAVRGGRAEVRVADTGTGILEAIRHKIFTPFFTTKDVGRGTGQGLSIAHTAVVEKLGGSLDFETVMGEGTTFFIRLPLEQGGRP